jgi:hypothetical protein
VADHRASEVETTAHRIPIDRCGRHSSSNVKMQTILSFSPVANDVGDGIDESSELTLSGDAHAKRYSECFDSWSFLGVTSVNGNGVWTFLASIARRHPYFTATDTDAASNTSVASSAFIVTVDVVAPAAPRVGVE